MDSFMSPDLAQWAAWPMALAIVAFFAAITIVLCVFRSKKVTESFNEGREYEKAVNRNLIRLPAQDGGD